MLEPEHLVDTGQWRTGTKDTKRVTYNMYYLAQKYRHKRFGQYLCLEQKIYRKISEIQKLHQIFD